MLWGLPRPEASRAAELKAWYQPPVPLDAFGVKSVNSPLDMKLQLHLGQSNAIFGAKSFFREVERILEYLLEKKFGGKRNFSVRKFSKLADLLLEYPFAKRANFKVYFLAKKFHFPNRFVIGVSFGGDIWSQEILLSQKVSELR